MRTTAVLPSELLLILPPVQFKGVFSKITYCELLEGTKAELGDCLDYFGHLPELFGRAFENARQATEGAANLHGVDGSLGANGGC